MSVLQSLALEMITLALDITVRLLRKNETGILMEKVCDFYLSEVLVSVILRERCRW